MNDFIIDLSNSLTTAPISLIISVAIVLLEILGILAAVHAIMSVRTSQGAIAWSLSLITLPYLALPLYLILGRTKFKGYVNARRVGKLALHRLTTQAAREARQKGLALADGHPEHHLLEALARMRFTVRNDVQLLIDGQATFDALFNAIEQAEDYILLQFYLVRDDQVGNELLSRLLRKANEGVRVYFLYDEIGSHRLSRKYIRRLREAGVDIRPFYSTRGRFNRFQLNFRNHRKIVVVDGRIAFLGGLNVGDEYMGRDEEIGPWRDTHLELAGPAVQAAQLVFLEDWYWSCRELPEVCWTARESDQGDRKVLILPSGPSDRLETCGLFFVHAINAARQRLWIASPYFVPDSQVICALQLAALRGVDVRILLPEKSDQLLVYLSSFTYLENAERAGVGIYRYQPGFLHYKALLVDDHLATVGTANLDNRSFRLNFEVTAVVDDTGFAAEVERMMLDDLSHCRLSTLEDLRRRPFWFRLAARVARLMSPLQ